MLHLIYNSRRVPSPAALSRSRTCCCRHSPSRATTTLSAPNSADPHWYLYLLLLKAEKIIRDWIKQLRYVVAEVRKCRVLLQYAFIIPFVSLLLILQVKIDLGSQQRTLMARLERWRGEAEGGAGEEWVCDRSTGLGR